MQGHFTKGDTQCPCCIVMTQAGQLQVMAETSWFYQVLPGWFWKAYGAHSRAHQAGMTRIYYLVRWELVLYVRKTDTL